MASLTFWNRKNLNPEALRSALIRAGIDEETLNRIPKLYATYSGKPRRAKAPTQEQTIAVAKFLQNGDFHSLKRELGNITTQKVNSIIRSVVEHAASNRKRK